MVPTRRLAVVAVAIAAVAWWYPGELPGGLWGALGIVNGFLAVVVAVDLLAAVRPASIEVVRRHPPTAVMGESVPLGWTVRHRGSRRVRVAIADDLAPSLGAVTRRASAVLPARGTAELTTTLRPRRRGRFDLVEVAVRTTGPLGLVQRERRRDVPTVLRVHPPFRSREEAELRIRRARILEVGMRSARGLGGGTEFEQLREYSPDDEFRRIDWAASARTGRPIVRTYRPELNQSVVVLLDNGRLSAARVAGVPRLEHGMDAAIMLTAVATRLGDKVGLVTFDQEIRSVVAPARRVDQVTRVTEAMYALEPVLAESDYRMALRHVTTRFRRRSLFVLLTDLNEQAWLESLLPQLPRILRHHVVVVGSVTDPDVARWATEAVADSHDAYRRAAAIAALDERRRVADRLRVMGATVVDAPPGKLAGELTDVYLKVKSTGRL